MELFHLLDHVDGRIPVGRPMLGAMDTCYRPRWVGLAALLLAEAMNLLDATIVQVAAPVIRLDLGGPAAVVQWLSAAYTLPFAVLLVTGGRLGDILGRRRTFRVGVVVFVLASVGCALSPATGVLITARAVQGAAAALVVPQTIGLIRAMFAGPELSKAMGSIGPVMGLAAVSGPVLGGVLTHADLFGSSWRAVFLVNVPLGAAVLLVAPLLREDRAPRRPRLDLVGTVLVVLGTGLVVTPLIEAGPLGWPGWTWLVVAAGVAVLVLFARHQRRGGSLVEVSLFARRAFPAALVVSTLLFAVMSGVLLVVVLLLQLGLHVDVQTAGLSLVPWSVGLAVASWVSGARLVPRFGAAVLPAALATLLVGLAGAVVACLTGDPWALLGALGVGGLGFGLFAPAFFTVALRVVDPHETGSAAGLLNAVQQLGGTLGVAVLGSIALGTPGAPEQGAALAFGVAAGLVLLAVPAVRGMTGDARSSTHRGRPRVAPRRPGAYHGGQAGGAS